MNESVHLQQAIELIVVLNIRLVPLKERYVNLGRVVCNSNMEESGILYVILNLFIPVSFNMRKTIGK